VLDNRSGIVLRVTTAAEILRAARRNAGLSQRAAAAAAGVQQPLIARIESGRVQPSLPTLERLVRGCAHELALDVLPLPDPHDLSLLHITLGLTPQQRVDRLVRLNRTARELQAAVRAVTSMPP
jgi:transcriptional regulator with XRE-family HTH domain